MVEQFDIIENPDAKSRSIYPFLIVLQHNRAETIATVVTAPLAAWTSQLAASRMHPELEVNGRRYVIFVEQLAAIPRRALGRVIATGNDNEYKITAALDMLFTGI